MRFELRYASDYFEAPDEVELFTLENLKILMEEKGHQFVVNMLSDEPYQIIVYDAYLE